MSAYGSIDLDTFRQIQHEVMSTLATCQKVLADHQETPSKDNLLDLIKHLHQVNGILHMLELKPLSVLAFETRLLIESVAQDEHDSKTDAMEAVVISALHTIESAFDLIETQQTENILAIVELINQIRSVRGKKAIEISSLFSPNVEVYPKPVLKTPLPDEEYQLRALALRVHFQKYVLEWLRDNNQESIAKLSILSERLLSFSTFGVVARLWWVLGGYVDFIHKNEPHSQTIHGRIFSGINDILYKLEMVGESALVREPGDELVKIMLFYIGTGRERSNRMDEISLAFKLGDHFPALGAAQIQAKTDVVVREVQATLSGKKALLQQVQQNITDCFSAPETSQDQFDETIEIMESIKAGFVTASADHVKPMLDEATKLIKALSEGSQEFDEQTSFHLAASLMLMFNAADKPDIVDVDWLNDVKHKRKELQAINSKETIDNQQDSNDLGKSERQALIDAISSEVNGTLSSIKSDLQKYEDNPTDGELLQESAERIRQIHGALQVLGEHKMGLLLKISEGQFSGLESGQIEPSKQLIDALAVAVETMTQYVRGVQQGQLGIDEMLDRSISDLEAAIGKKVSRTDLEKLIGETSELLFSWLTEQSDFELFNSLKYGLRDLKTLSRNFGLMEVEQLIKEQNRLVDAISQEPSFLNDAVISNLQTNMAAITVGIVELHDNQESEQEEIPPVSDSNETAPSETDTIKIHDHMDSRQILNQQANANEQPGAAETGQHDEQQNQTSDEIFEAFIEESGNIINRVKELYTKCSINIEDRVSLRELRRCFHTLKGSARTVGLDKLGEIAWFSESLLNYVLDTERSLTEEILQFADECISEFEQHLSRKYKFQDEIDTEAWGAKTEIISINTQIKKPGKDTSLDLVEADLSKFVNAWEDSVNYDTKQQPNNIELESEDQTSDHLPESDHNYVEFAQASELEIDSKQALLSNHEFRNVFIDEASAHLQAMKQALSKRPIFPTLDDPLYIAIHTLLGNARTLQLDEVANAFEIAESICDKKQTVNNALSDLEQNALIHLNQKMQLLVASLNPSPPYIKIEQQEWLDTTKLLQESGSQAEPNRNISTQEEAQQAINKVSAVFDSLESIDDLLGEQKDGLINVDQTDTVLIDETGNLDTLDNTATERKSLLPDDLTDLVDQDMALEGIAELHDNYPGEPEERPAVEAKANYQQSSENEHVDPQIKEIFLQEMNVIQSDLDREVAELQSLEQAPQVIPNVIRYLHTIKGSALMAEAVTLGELTHQTESYLESIFIHNEDELAKLRKTLECYIDALHSSIKAYIEGSDPDIPVQLINEIGRNDEDTVLDRTPSRLIDPEEPQTEPLEEALAQFQDHGTNVHNILQEWKTIRDWKTTQDSLAIQIKQTKSLLTQFSSHPKLNLLIDGISIKISSLSIKNRQALEAEKDLLQEATDVLFSNIRSLLNDGAVEDLGQLQKRLAGESSSPVEPTSSPTSQTTPETAYSFFVPAAKNTAKQNHTPTTSTALRIDTETLDSISNFVGDSNMNRSQLRVDVQSVKSIINVLNSNVAKFNSQLRELEIEAEGQITSRGGQLIMRAEESEFDSLELDRYTKIQQLSRELIENLDELQGVQTSLTNFIHKAETTLQRQDRLNRELQDEILHVRLVSFGGLAPKLRQVVRSTARQLEKEVELEIIGSEVKMDKTILEGVEPAIEHMLRNAVDHGIEKPKIRESKKKPRIGRVVVECRQVAREIIINIRDDGTGLDLEKIHAKAIKLNLLDPDEPLNAENIMLLISQSGFSTASQLTQISGRGVGMDVVQTSIRKLSGTIFYHQDANSAGSSFSIRLPISLAVTSAMFVDCGEETFAVPARAIEQVISFKRDELLTKLSETIPKIEIEDKTYSLIELSDYLGFKSSLAQQETLVPVILVDSGVQNLAVIVEGLQDTQEIVVKGLGEHLGRIPIYSGATIRADGSAILLLDLVGISFYESSIGFPDLDLSAGKIPNVMVVDDSLTVRKSSERDITSMGINAVLAKDGLDAQQQLTDPDSNIPDLILLDIEMPNMDGFEFLAWVKSHKPLKNVPIVMISSRSTEKHIEKATDLGAKAFLGKPYLIENLVNLFNKYLPLQAPITLDIES